MATSRVSWSIIRASQGLLELVFIMRSYNYEKLLCTVPGCSRYSLSIWATSGHCGHRRHASTGHPPWPCQPAPCPEFLWIWRKLSNAGIKINHMENLIQGLVQLLGSSKINIITCTADILSNLTSNNQANSVGVCQVGGIQAFDHTIVAAGDREIAQPAVCVPRHLTSRHTHCTCREASQPCTISWIWRICPLACRLSSLSSHHHSSDSSITWPLPGQSLITKGAWQFPQAGPSACRNNPGVDSRPAPMQQSQNWRNCWGPLTHSDQVMNTYFVHFWVLHAFFYFYRRCLVETLKDCIARDLWSATHQSNQGSKLTFIVRFLSLNFVLFEWKGCVMHGVLYILSDALKAKSKSNMRKLAGWFVAIHQPSLKISNIPNELITRRWLSLSIIMNTMLYYIFLRAGYGGLPVDEAMPNLNLDGSNVILTPTTMPTALLSCNSSKKCPPLRRITGFYWLHQNDNTFHISFLAQ